MTTMEKKKKEVFLVRREQEGGEKRLKCDRFLWLPGTAWLGAGREQIAPRRSACLHLSLSGRKYKTTT